MTIFYGIKWTKTLSLYSANIQIQKNVKLHVAYYTLDQNWPIVPISFLFTISNRMRSGENPSLCWLISAYHYFSENKPARLVANIRSAIFLRLRNFSILYGLHIKTFRRYHAWYYSCTFAICIIIITRIYVYVTWFAHISRRFNGSPLRIAYYW